MQYQENENKHSTVKSVDKLANNRRRFSSTELMSYVDYTGTFSFLPLIKSDGRTV